MSISLAAVFIPVFFMGGILGRLLHEFAVVIIVAVLISGFVSLTLTPMMCSRILKPHDPNLRHGRLFMAFERGFDAWRDFYGATLRWVLAHQRVTMLAFLAICVATGVLFARAPKGFLPSEDSGQLFIFTEGPQDVSFDGMVELQRQVAEIVRQDPNIEAIMSFVGASNFNPAMNSGRITIALKPYGKRKPADPKGLFLNKTTTIADALVVQDRLNNVQLQLEEVRGQLRYLDDQTSFATITLNVAERGVPVAKDKDGGGWGIGDAWRAAADGFMKVVGGVFVGVATAGPILIALALAFFAWRFFGKRRQVKRQAGPAVG